MRKQRGKAARMKGATPQWRPPLPMKGIPDEAIATVKED
jgi:hypothetical protein